MRNHYKRKFSKEGSEEDSGEELEENSGEGESVEDLAEEDLFEDAQDDTPPLPARRSTRTTAGIPP